MTASYIAASLPAALVAKQNRLRCSSPAGFIRSGGAPRQCSYCNPKTAAVIKPCWTHTGSLQITLELHCISLSRTTRPGSTRAQVALHKPAQIQPNRCWARPGWISLARPALAQSTVSWICLHHSAQCLWDGALPEVGEMPAAPAGLLHAEDAPVLALFCSAVT